MRLIISLDSCHQERERLLSAFWDLFLDIQVTWIRCQPLRNYALPCKGLNHSSNVVRCCTLPSNSLRSKNNTLTREWMQISWGCLIVSFSPRQFLGWNRFRFAHYIVCLLFYTGAVWLKWFKTQRPTNYVVQWSILVQEGAVLPVLNLIAASFIITGCLLSVLKQSKLPLSLAIMLNRVTAATVRTGNWPALIEMPPEACNQATGQLWGPWGGTSPDSKGLHIYCLSRCRSLIHIFTCTLTDVGGGTFEILYTETAFRDEERGLFFRWAIFSIDKFIQSSFQCVAIVCMVVTVCHSGIFSQLLLIVLHKEELCLFPLCTYVSVNNPQTWNHQWFNFAWYMLI